MSKNGEKKFKYVEKLQKNVQTGWKSVKNSKKYRKIIKHVEKSL